MMSIELIDAAKCECGHPAYTHIHSMAGATGCCMEAVGLHRSGHPLLCGCSEYQEKR